MTTKSTAPEPKSETPEDDTSQTATGTPEPDVNAITADVTGLETVTDPLTPGRFTRIRRSRRTVPAAVAVAMIASVTGAGVAYMELYRPDQATDDATRAAVVDAANDGTVALLSYGHKSLNADFAKAREHLTGQFLTYYNEFTEKVVTPAATDNTVNTTAEVVRSAVSDLGENEAHVLAFVNQTTTSKTEPDPELTSSSVRVSLQRVDGNWRISSFDPV
ncbi:hypothetical protein [Gordonia sp. NPDC127522]|uniref:hypothetical protein n=1 Tax=Gordonia sp. NPDC127522 TaxID=3345390 RepID=UPI0036325D11